MTPASRDETMSAWLEAAWMARYLERGLSEDEAAWFEAYVLDKPHLIEAIERDSDLRDALDAVRPELANAASNAGAPAAPVTPSARRPWRSLPLAAAASLVAGVLGLWLGAGLGPPSEASLDPPLLHIQTLRGTDAIARLDGGHAGSPDAILEIVLPPGTTYVDLRLGALHVGRAVRETDLLTLVVPTRALREAPALELTFHAGDARQSRRVALPRLPGTEDVP